jgi:hypothetical protein
MTNNRGWVEEQLSDPKQLRVAFDQACKELAELEREAEALRSGVRDTGHEISHVRGGEPGWVRIGRYDRAERRSLWCRVVNKEGDTDGLDDPIAIELCSGREGDDAYVKLTAADPQWGDLCNLLLRVEGDCGLHEEKPK